MGKQATLLDLPQAGPRQIKIAGMEDPVAQVLLDVPLPHFHAPLDYLIPPDLAQRAQVGMGVQVRLAGVRRSGWIVGRSSQTEHQGGLSSIQKVIGQAPQISPKLAAISKLVAQHYCGAVADVINLAKPKRVAGAEKEFALTDFGADAALPVKSLPGANHSVFELYPAGSAWLDHLAQGASPHAVWDCLPQWENDWAEAFVESAIATLKSNRDVILLAPNAKSVERLMTVVRSRGLAGIAVDLHSEVADSMRYRNYLKVLSGQAHLVVGTQSAALAPVRNLGLVACFDDGSDNYQFRQSPYPNAVRILGLRANYENAAFLVASYGRTLESELLIQTGWAAPISGNRATIRAYTPHVSAPAKMDLIEREGITGQTRLPQAAYRLVEKGLESGPVLVQVPRNGYANSIRCACCFTRLHCQHCGGPARGDSQNRFVCAFCGRDLSGQRCHNCGHSRWRSFSIGTNLTARELGKSFQNVPIAISGSGSVVVKSVDKAPRLVIATPGAEPYPENGYSAVIILDAFAIAQRTEIWAPTQAARRFFNALALGRPKCPALVLGLFDANLAKALENWDSAALARQWLQERTDLQLLPAARFVAVIGNGSDVNEFTRHFADKPVQVLGPFATEGGETKMLLRFTSQQVISDLYELVVLRSAKRLPPVKVVVDPVDLA